MMKPAEIEISEEFQAFVDANLQTDPSRLRLKYRGDSRRWVPLAIDHIECLKKSRDKFGDLQPRLMAFPLSVEQATSQSVARFHASMARRYVGKISRMADLTLGMGIDLRAMALANPGLEAVGIEMKPEFASVAAYNFRDLPSVTIINDDCTRWLANQAENYAAKSGSDTAQSGNDAPQSSNTLGAGKRYDLLFLDPARRDACGGRVYNIHDCQPDAAMLLSEMARIARYAMIKLSPMLDVSQTLADLPGIIALHIVEERGECRELLAVIDLSKVAEVGKSAKEVPVVVNSGDKEFTFDRIEEAEALAAFGAPKEGMYLYEPSPAMMKAAPFSLLSTRFGMKKLHPNTNLYLADIPLATLPGRWNLIERVVPFNSRNAKALAREIDGADVAVRNAPLQAETLSKRYGFRPGGSHRLMLATAVSATDSASQKQKASLRGETILILLRR